MHTIVHKLVAVCAAILFISTGKLTCQCLDYSVCKFVLQGLLTMTIHYEYQYEYE